MMSSLLLLILLLQLKHLFADYYLQTGKMLSGRGEYMHVGRAQHASVHAIGTLIALILVGTSVLPLLVLTLFDWVVHFHIDFWKGRYSDKKCLAPDQAAFWRAFGFDQFLHQLTYVALAWLWMVWA